MTTLAKKAVTEILHQMGWNDIVDLGNIEISRHLEVCVCSGAHLDSVQVAGAMLSGC